MSRKRREAVEAKRKPADDDSTDRIAELLRQAKEQEQRKEGEEE